MRIWLAQHARTLAATLARFARSPLSSLLNVAVIGVALALPVSLYVILGNLQQLAQAHGSTPQLSLYMALDAGDQEVALVRDRLQQDPRVGRFSFVPRDQALQDLKSSAGLAEVVDSLHQNPLPHAFVVDPRSGSAESLERLRDELRKWPKVAHVQLDSAWARRLDALLRVGAIALLLLAAALAFGMVTVTFNTIRLHILTQREEVEVSRLLGATDPFIRRPFLYYGVILGAAGAAAAWVLVWLGVYVLNQGLTEIGQLYGTGLQLRPLTAEDSGGILVLSAALCWLGAWLSVRRHLG